MKSGIYIITNIVTHKVYVGSAVNIKLRWNKHKHLLKENRHHSKHLQNSYNKYGTDNFIYGILEYCDDKLLLIGREQLWLNYFECYNHKYGYNVSPTAYSILGLKRSDETKRKLSLVKTGFKHSPQTIKRMSDIKKGKRHKPESYQKTIETKRAKGILKLSDETKLKMSLAKKDKSRPYKRKSDKWPHELGSKCKCRDCRDKRNKIQNLNNLKRINSNDA